MTFSDEMAGDASLFDAMMGEAALVPTLSVKQINEAISDAIAVSFPKAVWVKGEVQRLNFHTNGHTYFTLVDCDSRGAAASTISVSLFRNTKAKIKGDIKEILGEDREVRLLVRPDYYAPYGRMSLIVEEIDTAFTLGQIAMARRELLEKLAKENILRKNAELELDDLCLNVVLITAHESAAFHDVTDHFESSGVGYKIKVITALMQGSGSAQSVAKALKKANKIDADVILICRGGGAKSDLSSFDSELVARAICDSNKPVLTGLGHQIDISVADLVAHSHFKTPTACAEFIIARTCAAISVTEEVFEEIRNITDQRLSEAETRLAYISQRISDSNNVVERAANVLESLKRVLTSASRARFETESAMMQNLSSRLKSNSLNFLGITNSQLQSLSQVIKAHDPQGVLERGYSMTTDEQGNLIASVEGAPVGKRLRTRFADGTAESIVEKTMPN